MENGEKNLPEELEEVQEEKPAQETKHAWQALKESWYDKIPLNLKQMNIIVVLCWVAIALLIVAMYLDTTGIVKFFP